MQLRDAPLDPGSYVVSIADAPNARVLPVLSVPEGYAGIEEAIGVVATDMDGAEEAYLWVWQVSQVHSHPCNPNAAVGPVGPSVAELADALAAAPVRVATDPVPVTVGGHDGLYLELTVPAGTDVRACPEQAFAMWPGRWQQYPGQVDMVWIVDVDGQRVVFDASHTEDASPDKVDQLEDMVTTATFTPADGT